MLPHALSPLIPRSPPARTCQLRCRHRGSFCCSGPTMAGFSGGHCSLIDWIDSGGAQGQNAQSRLRGVSNVCGRRTFLPSPSFSFIVNHLKPQWQQLRHFSILTMLFSSGSHSCSPSTMLPPNSQIPEPCVFESPSTTRPLKALAVASSTPPKIRTLALSNSPTPIRSIPL